MLKTRLITIDEIQRVEWFCPNCGYKRIFILTPKHTCVICLTSVPDIQDMIKTLNSRIKYHNSSKLGVVYDIC